MSDHEQSSPNHERLDRAMQARMAEFGLQWVELARYARTSTQTIRNLRDGKTVPRKETQNRLEDGLLWERGSIMRALRGGHDPIPLSPEEAGRDPRTPAADPAPEPQESTPFFGRARNLTADIERLGLNPEDPDVQHIVNLRHLSRRAKIRFLAELADAIAEAEANQYEPKDKSPKRGNA